MLTAIRYRLLTIALLAVAPSTAVGQSPPSLSRADTLSLDPVVRHGRLPNGFEYYIRRNTEPKGKVEMRLVVKAGRLHEDEDQLGLAHLLEHMAFNGTAHYPGNAVKKHFDEWGLVPGNDWNASTGGVTKYQLTLPADRPAVYESGFQIMRDWAQSLTLDSAAIEAERGVVLGESRNGENTNFKLRVEMDARLLDHPKYPLDFHQKHDENIRTFEHEALRRFYRDWYRPDLQALLVVGDVDVGDVEQRIIALFSDLEMPAHPREVPDVYAQYEVELTGKNQFLVLTAEELRNTTMRIYHKGNGKGTTIRTVGDYRRALVDQLYNTMMQARLGPLTQRYNPPFESFGHSVDRSAFRLTARIDALYTYLAFDQAQPIGPGIRAALLELERVRRYGFTAGELERAREVVRKELADNCPGMADNCRRTSGYLVNGLVAHYAEGAAAPDLDYERALRKRLLDEIDVDEMNAIFREWVGSTTDRDVVIRAPTSEIDRLPTEAEVESWFTEARRRKVEPYREPPPPIQQLMTEAEVARLRFDTSYTVRHNEEIGTTELRLRNGITVVLKPFKPVGFRADKVSLTGSSTGGFASYRGEQALIARHAASIVQNAGVGPFDRFQLETFLKTRNVDGGPPISGPIMSEDAAQIGGYAPAKELETLLQLMHLYLTVPRRDSASFEEWKLRQLTAIEYRNTSPAGRFRAVIDSVRYQGRVANSLPTPQDISRIREEAVYRFYEERFTKPGDFVFVLAGDFDPEMAKPLLVRYLGSLPAARADRPNDRGSHVQARMGKADVTAYRGTEEKADVRLFFSGEYTPTLLTNLKLELLWKALDIRMWDRLREKEGGTYSVVTNIEAGRWTGENSYFFGVSFIAAPDNGDHMIAAAVEEVERLRDEGLDPALFEAVVNRVRNNPWPPNDVKTTSFWVEYLLDTYHRQGDPSEILKRRSLLTDILTREALNEAARRYLRLKNLMRFVLLPEKYKPVSE